MNQVHHRKRLRRGCKLKCLDWPVGYLRESRGHTSFRPIIYIAPSDKAAGTETYFPTGGKKNGGRDKW